MELTGEQVLSAPRNDVYAMLHDPATLRQAIPGCQRFTQIDATRYEAEIALKIGPISSTFLALVTLYNDDAPMGFSMHGHADSGRAVGGADGNAHVALAVIDENTTNLAYHCAVTPLGRIGDLPDDVIDKKARTLTAEFFSRLQLLLDGGDVIPAEQDTEARWSAAPTRERYGDTPPAAAEPVREPAGSEAATEWQSDEEWERAHQAAIAALRGSADTAVEERPATRDRTMTTTAADDDATSRYPGYTPVAPENETYTRPRSTPSPTYEAPRAEAGTEEDMPTAVVTSAGYRAITTSPTKRETAPQPASDGPSGLGRWFLVAVGVCIIAYLLLDSF